MLRPNRGVTFGGAGWPPSADHWPLTHTCPRWRRPRGLSHAFIPFYAPFVRSHVWIDRRSLAVHEAVAAKLEAHPQLLEVARANLRRWLNANPVSDLHEWQDLLDRTPLPELLALLRSPSDAAVRLRQPSPFAGVLSPEEPQSILSHHDPRRA